MENTEGIKYFSLDTHVSPLRQENQFQSLDKKFKVLSKKVDMTKKTTECNSAAQIRFAQRSQY